MYSLLKLVAILLCSSIFFACKRDAPGQNASGLTTSGAIDTASGGPVNLPNPWVNATCTLFSDDEVEALFNIDAKTATLNTQSLPDKAFCLRTWKKPDWKERETANERSDGPYLQAENRLVLQVINYHTDEHAKSQFEFLKNERADEYEEKLPDLGDGAIWSTAITTLIVRKGHLLVSIQLEYLDNKRENLGKAREIAMVALGKMENPD